MAFLVARGRRTGYRTVLAPDFLTERNLHGVLSATASGDHLAADRSRVDELEHADVGRLTLCFKTERLASADLNGKAGQRQPTRTSTDGRSRSCTAS